MRKITTYESNPEILVNDADFSSERELKRYIIDNKDIFCKEILGFEYQDHIEEFALPKGSYLNEPRVDIVFISKDGGCHYIELKNPRYAYSELCMGLTQCLSYKYIANLHGLMIDSVSLLTTKHSHIIPLIIKENQLDVRYIYFDKTKHAIFLTGKEDNYGTL